MNLYVFKKGQRIERKNFITRSDKVEFNIQMPYFAKENNKTYSSNDLRIVTDIEGGNVYKVTRLSKNHFRIEMRPDKPSDFKYPDHHSYWFYLKVEGVKEKALRLDIKNCAWMRTHWKYYKPVFSYAEDPDSHTGVVWHRIGKTKLRWKTFSFEQNFEKDFAWIALRYPFNYSHLRRYMNSIKGNEYVDIEELGKTAMENSLYMIIVTDKRVPSDGKKGVLIYAREHGIEQDGSWVAEGMIDFLISSKPPADILRRKLIFMIIPIISPDSAILGRTVDPTTGKCVGGELAKDRMDSIEAKLLYERVKRFVEQGNPLDISISFHNPHGTEPNLYPAYRPYNDISRLEKGQELHKAISKHSKEYTQWKEFTYKSCNYSVGRFAKDFGSTAILYEINHQAKNNYLSLEKLKGMGEIFLRGIADYHGLKQ